MQYSGISDIQDLSMVFVVGFFMYELVITFTLFMVIKIFFYTFGKKS